MSITHLKKTDLSLERELRLDLARAYRIFSLQKMDDHTYTHISARIPGSNNEYFINPFGSLFEEIKAKELAKVDFHGNPIDSCSAPHVNQTGLTIHGNIYKRFPEINCVIHLHTSDSIAVSVLKEGLLPLSQFALHLYNKVGYHAYEGLILTDVEAEKLAKEISGNHAVLLRNHGLLAYGRTLQEACFFAYHLEQACRVQCKLLSMERELVLPSPEICEKANEELLTFEKNLGKRDWDAWVRKIDRTDSSYKENI